MNELTSCTSKSVINKVVTKGKQKLAGMGLNDCLTRLKLALSAASINNNIQKGLKTKNLKRKTMGLDMYLYKKTVDENLTKVGYWRRTGQIHSWFVHNVQNNIDDCGTYFVSEEQLEELLELCKKVLDKNELANKLLPSTSGDYDEFYFSELTNTVEIIESLRNEDGHLDGDFYYSSSR